MLPEEFIVLGDLFRTLLHSGGIAKQNAIGIYIRTSPEVALERIRARGRPEEASVDLKMLQELHQLHETWLLPQETSKDGKIRLTRVYIIDGDRSPPEILAEMEKVIVKERPLMPKLPKYCRCLPDQCLHEGRTYL